MSRPSNTEQRRRQIARGLRRVMARKGYQAATIAEIARAARLASGLVHYHFSSKRDILLAMLDELSAEHRTRIEAAVAAAGAHPARRLERFIDAHLAVGPEADPEALACWIALAGEALRDRLVRQRFRAVLEELVERVQELLAPAMQTGPSGSGARAAACAIVAAIEGYLVLAGTAGDLIPAGTAAAQVQCMALALAKQLGVDLDEERP
jgi:TetR/AcrR family transcriptional repressor of bet genes